MTDTMSSVSTIQSWISNMQSVATNLPDAIDTTTPSDFAQALSQMQAVLDADPGAASADMDVADGTTNSADLTGAPSTSTSPSDVTGSQVVATANQYLGVPYQWGGTTPSGFDCSGFTQYVYGQLGISIPRTAAEQSTVGTPVASLADAQPGDLVFFAGSDGTAASPGHVGIYIGNGQMIDAPETGEDVSIQPVGTPVAIRQIIPSATSTSSTMAPDQSTSSSSSVPANLSSYFVDAAGQYGLPVQLLTAVARTESNFNPSAVSSAGAEGIMQLMPSTAASLGVNPMDPQQSIDGAAQLLSGYITQFGSVPLALAAYNAGPGAVEQYGGIPPYPQTEAYVQQIMQSLGGTTGSTQ